jgi:hypothetical protein
MVDHRAIIAIREKYQYSTGLVLTPSMQRQLSSSIHPAPNDWFITGKDKR